MSSSSTGINYGYIACANVKPTGMGAGRLEVLVATRRGCAYVYDWGAGAGGEGRLRGEHSIAPENLDELLSTRCQTPRQHGSEASVIATPTARPASGAATTPAKEHVEAPTLQNCNLQKVAQLGA